MGWADAIGVTFGVAGISIVFWFVVALIITWRS